MTGSVLRPLRSLVLAALVLLSCDETLEVGTDARPGTDATPPDADAASTPNDADRGEVAADGGDSSHPPDPGPLTLVANALAMTDTRRCDLDGDGQEDNAIADLGVPSSTLFAATVSSLLDGFIDRGEGRFIFYFPWVDDRREPSTEAATFYALEAWDTDDPIDPLDDFSGGEPFVVRFPEVYLDACGEPYFESSMSFSAGAVEGMGGVLPLPVEVGHPIPGRGLDIIGTIGPNSAEADFEACAYVLIRDLGAMGGIMTTGDVTMLEVFVDPRSAFGIPGIDGLTPDVDLDGDGLERLLSGEDGRIHGCVDGDGTVIDGFGCWEDERMADAFSLYLTVSVVRAEFVGCFEQWDYYIAGTCEEWPTERSLCEPTAG